jgi:hypothetical protein
MFLPLPYRFKERDLDFEVAVRMFAGGHFTSRDDRIHYGEDRFIMIGPIAWALAVSRLDIERRCDPHHFGEESQ